MIGAEKGDILHLKGDVPGRKGDTSAQKVTKSAQKGDRNRPKAGNSVTHVNTPCRGDRILTFPLAVDAAAAHLGVLC